MHAPDTHHQTISDTMDPARAAALHTALGRDGSPPEDVLPPFWHQIYFWDVKSPQNLGRDGHPKVGGLIPDMGLPRRMWAGGRLDFHAPLRLGRPAEKRSRAIATRRTEGRSGALAFVTLRHDIDQDGRTVVSEEQDLVYRAEPDAAAPPPDPPAAPTDEDTRTETSFDAVLLFRYSALTLFGHRIHYDADYSRDVEGYPGLVVHGPLLAQLLADLGDRRAGGLARFSFRATAPLFAGETAELCAAGSRLWARGPGGRLAMQAEAG